MKYIKFLFTNEDWCPSFKRPDGDMVLASYGRSGSKGSPWIVSVWGNDDMGMEKFPLQQWEAIELFNKLKDYVTKEELKKMGFVPA